MNSVKGDDNLARNTKLRGTYQIRSRCTAASCRLSTRPGAPKASRP
ncbi:hypothetical protein [Paenibacillus zanthoxyli]|nr:hypothetical protein [Paenibacillus zanthoxyli]